jgi:hypothetical protein
MVVPRKGLIALTVFGIVVVVLTAGSLHPTTSPYLGFGNQYPAFIAPQILDSENRLLTASQCQDRYPGLYYEADRARAYYAKKGGISQEMVESADKDGASARLAIINNKVDSSRIARADDSYTSKRSMVASIPERKLQLRPCGVPC